MFFLPHDFKKYIIDIVGEVVFRIPVLLNLIYEYYELTILIKDRNLLNDLVMSYSWFDCERNCKSISGYCNSGMDHRFYIFRYFKTHEYKKLLQKNETIDTHQIPNPFIIFKNIALFNHPFLVVNHQFECHEYTSAGEFAHYQEMNQFRQLMILAN